MDSRMSDVDYEGLDRLLGALGESVASRVHLDETALSDSSSIPEALPAAWRDTATAVQVDTLPRGVPLRTVFRGVLGHFFPAAAVVMVPLVIVVFLFNPFDYAQMLPGLGGLLMSTLGFGLGLGALSPWLYPHSNPDGRRSEVAGFVSPFAWLPVGFGLAGLFQLPVAIPGMAWLIPLLNAMPFWGGFLLTGLISGLILAVVAYAPWLRRTSNIAPASPPRRWAKLRATAVTGGLGAVMFGSAMVIRPLFPPLPTGIALWPGLLFNLAFGASFGFLIGVAFAMALAVVYRRYTVEELRAWKVGLWAAAAAAIPPLVIVIQRAPGQPDMPHPLVELMSVLFAWNLPGFLMGYFAVKLAQRSRPTE